MAFPSSQRVVAYTANKTLSRALNPATGQYDLGAIHNNRGAGATVTLTVPVGEVGDVYHFDTVAAQALNIYVNASAIFELSGTAYTAGYYLQNSGTAGESLTIVCVAANTWTVRNPIGSHWSVASTAHA